MNSQPPEYSVLSDAEATLALMLSGSEEMFFLVDRHFVIRLYNDTAKAETLKHFDVVLKPGLSILCLLQKYERTAYLKKIYAEVFNGATHEADEEWLKDGKTTIYRNRMRPARAASGEIVGAIVTVYDITEKRATEKALKESEERLRFALEASNHGIWDWNIKSGEVHFSPSWKKMLGFEEWEIQNTIEEWEKRIHPEDKDQLTRDLDTHFQSEQPTYENKYRLRAKDNSYKWIQGRGKIVSYAADGSPLRMIGTHTDITEKYNSEEQYRNLFDLNPLPTWIYDFATLQILAVNKAALQHYGYTKEEFLQLTILDVNLPEHLNTLQQHLENREQEINHRLPNWKHRKKDGTIIFVDISGNTIFYNNRKARLVVVNDITEKVSAEEELKRSNELFQYVTKATFDAIYDADPINGHLSWGDGYTTLFGYTALQSTLHEWETHVHPDDRGAILKRLHETMYHNSKKLWRGEYRFKKRDGTYRYVIDKGFILRNAENIPVRMIGAMQDVTDVIEKQEELTESNKRYKYVALAVSEIIWDWDFQKHMVLWSDNYEKILGWKLPDDKVLMAKDCLHKIHEDDKHIVNESIQKAMVNQSQTIWEAEFRYLRSNGSYAYIYDRGYIIRDSAGAVIRMIGSMQDITNRKKLEEQLLQKELEKQKSISKATIETQERERSEIGKELHDNVNQVLTTTKLYMELAMSHPALNEELLQKSQKNIMYVINEIRQLSRSLIDPSLGDLGLVASIADLVESVRATRKINITFKADIIEDLLPDNLGLTLYRITQEALNNVVKHAQATQVSILLHNKGADVKLMIQDNGNGFDPKKIKQGAGLKSIKNRIYLTNGIFCMESEPGKGCTLAVQYDLKDN